MKNKNSFLLPTIGAIIALSFGNIIYKKYKNSRIIPKLPLNVSIEKVQITTLNLKSTFTGKVVTKQSVTLMPEVVGKVVYMKDDGSFVQKDETIIEFDKSEAQARYKATMGRCKKEKQELNNLKKLEKQGYASKDHVEKQEQEYNSASGQMEEAKANLEKHTIKASFDGTLGLHTQSIGSTVTVNTKLITLTNLENLQVEFSIPSSTLSEIGGIEKLKSSKILVFIENDLIPVSAKFAAIESVVESETNSLLVRVEIEKGEKSIAPGQIAKIIVSYGTKENALTISENALVAEHGREYVYKVEEGLSIQTSVKTGIVDFDKIEIIEGVKENDQIINSGQFRLADGQSVNVVDESE